MLTSAIRSKAIGGRTLVYKFIRGQQLQSSVSPGKASGLKNGLAAARAGGGGLPAKRGRPKAADPFLGFWRRHPDLNRGITALQAAALPLGYAAKKMERETGFEPATSTLARLHSTTELFPLRVQPFRQIIRLCQQKTRFKQAAGGPPEIGVAPAHGPFARRPLKPAAIS